MKKILAVLSIVAFVSLYSCSKYAGDPITQDFSIDGAYTELVAGDAFDVFVSDTVDKVVVTAGENVMPHVVVKQDGDKLHIYLKGWHSNRGKELKAIVPYSPNLNEVELSGASEFHSDFPLQAQKVEIDLSGASDFYADIEGEDVDADLSGSSDINGNVAATNLSLELSGSADANVTGRVSILKIEFSGASTLKRNVAGGQYALSCNQCEGSMSGSSDAYIHCEGSISVSLSGSSELHYTGRASTHGSSTSGSSEIVNDVL